MSMNNVHPWDLLNPNAPKSAEEEQAQRFALCQECEFFRASTQQCKKCGCFMKLKTMLQKAKCPMGKW